MLYKDGVIRHGLHWRMRKVEQVVDILWQEHGQEAVMTSGLNGTHGTWSWHYYGCAVDFRTRYFDNDTAAEVATELRRRLHPISLAYQVVLHAGSHIHVEFDQAVQHGLT